jgi:hypothetical protein
MTFAAMLKKPSAFAPLVMSLAAMGLLATAALTVGLVPQPDEGAFAHLWQLLMGLQLPVIAYCAIKWVPRAPRQALATLALQVGAMCVAAFPVFYFKL